MNQRYIVFCKKTILRNFKNQEPNKCTNKTETGHSKLNASDNRSVIPNAQIKPTVFIEKTTAVEETREPKQCTSSPQTFVTANAPDSLSVQTNQVVKFQRLIVYSTVAEYNCLSNCCRRNM